MVKKRRRHAQVKYKWLYTHTAEAECDDLRDFVYTMSSGLASEAKRFESLIARITAGMDEDRANDVAQQYADEAFGVLDRYPRVLWQSVFISIYAFFEEEMNTICRRVRTIATAKRLTAINVVVPAQVLPAQKCLARFSVRLAVKSAAWKRFLAYKAIRNIIAHNHGKKKNDTNGRIAEAFARRHANIEIEGGRITLNRDFCLSVIDDMRVILARTINAIPQKLFEYDPPTKLPRSVRHK